MPRAVLIGGTGMIGRAAARALATDGWDVVAVSRSGTLPNGLAGLGVTGVSAEREDDQELRATLGAGADVVVDTVAYGSDHAEQLNGLAGHAGSLVVISSAAVYVDDEGRGFTGAESLDDFPRFPVPIAESQPTVGPGAGDDYARGKVALEQALLAGPLPATLLRAGAIYGPGAKLPRELFFVKRILDGRRRVVLVSNGASVFHTVAAENIAELIRLAAAAPGDRVLNAGDPEPPTTTEICRAVSAALDRELEAVPVPESEFELPRLGNPWAVPEQRPVVLDMAAAERAIGYRPLAAYPGLVGATCAWVAEELERGRDWSDTYLGGSFDYEAEDDVLRSRA
ncbi:MAG: NAD-dependent epimerase/dehydratase family protein [Gaiellaceae bacterium]